ncbi:FAD-dependent oxidoreductase [Nocardia brasiliensis]|uniref:FAD-dependent oxidoreductase n=1 Tax=Nocardia brasiliensis TaxID=37326 RepID=UPI001EEC3891|nr:FAD-dependent oxidoreductase [Nocardia brasiliensis]
MIQIAAACCQHSGAALGSTVADFGVPGVVEHAHHVASKRAALRLRERLEQLRDGEPVLVVGGGLTSIEIATEIAEARPELRVAMAARRGVGDWLTDKAQHHLRSAFERFGITVRENADVSPEGVVTSSGARIDAQLTVWTAGFAVHPIAAASTLAVSETAADFGLVPRPGTSALVPVQAELSRQQYVLPIAFAREHMLVRRPHRPELQQCEAQIRARVLRALRADQFAQRDIAAVQRVHILAQAGPDPGVAVGRADVGLARRLVVDHIDALHVLQRATPIGPVLFDGDLQHAEGVIDLIVAGKWLTGVRRLQDRCDLDLVQIGLHVQPDSPTRWFERHDEALDERAHQVLAQLDIVSVRTGQGPPPDNLEDATE